MVSHLVVALLVVELLTKGPIRPLGYHQLLRRGSDVTVVLEWCYSGIRMVLQWCYRGVTLELLPRPAVVALRVVSW
jgi:hypothetical protein